MATTPLPADGGDPPARELPPRELAAVALPSVDSPGSLDHPAAAAAVALVQQAVDALAGVEAWRVSDSDLAALVQAGEVARRRLAMVQVTAAVEAGKRGLPRRTGFGPGRGVRGGDTAALAAWVRSLVNLTRADARQVAEVGAALFTDPVAADLAETRAAALTGQISARHVAVIAGAVTQLSPPLTPTEVVDEHTRRDAQKLLAEQAVVLDPVQTSVLATRAVAVLDPDAGDRLAKDEDLRATARGLSFTPDGTGLVHLRGTLTPTCAGLLATAIDSASAPRPATDGTPDPRTPDQRRHDGLHHVLAQVVAADGLLPTTHGSPYRLVVTIPHATLTAALTHQRELTGPGRFSEPVLPGLLPDGFPLSPLSVQTMACTADLVPVLVDDDHRPLDVGDTQYAFPPRTRTAIIARDRGCTYPGCGASAPWCAIHHLVRFGDGGPTSVDNGALLCGRHHRYVHALNLSGRVISQDGTSSTGRSRVTWDHRPTSWTATTATQTRRPHHTVNADGDHHDAGSPDDARPHGHDQHEQWPALTDRCLDELIGRWHRRRASRRSEAA